MSLIQYETEHELDESEKERIKVDFIAYGRVLERRAYVDQTMYDDLKDAHSALLGENEKLQAMYDESINVLMLISRASTRMKGVIAVIESYTEGEEW